MLSLFTINKVISISNHSPPIIIASRTAGFIRNIAIYILIIVIEHNIFRTAKGNILNGLQIEADVIVQDNQCGKQV